MHGQRLPLNAKPHAKTFVCQKPRRLRETRQLHQNNITMNIKNSFVCPFFLLIPLSPFAFPFLEFFLWLQTTTPSTTKTSTGTTSPTTTRTTSQTSTPTTTRTTSQTTSQVAVAHKCHACLPGDGLRRPDRIESEGRNGKAEERVTERDKTKRHEGERGSEAESVRVREQEA